MPSRRSSRRKRVVQRRLVAVEIEYRGGDQQPAVQVELGAGLAAHGRHPRAVRRVPSSAGTPRPPRGPRGTRCPCCRATRSRRRPCRRGAGSSAPAASSPQCRTPVGAAPPGRARRNRRPVAPRSAGTTGSTSRVPAWPSRSVAVAGCGVGQIIGHIALDSASRIRWPRGNTHERDVQFQRQRARHRGGLCPRLGASAGAPGRAPAASGPSPGRAAGRRGPDRPPRQRPASAVPSGATSVSRREPVQRRGVRAAVDSSTRREAEDLHVLLQRRGVEDQAVRVRVRAGRRSARPTSGRPRRRPKARTAARRILGSRRDPPTATAPGRSTRPGRPGPLGRERGIGPPAPGNLRQVRVRRVPVPARRP